MGTQGVLSICVGGKVAVKIVAGCGGMGLPGLAAAVRAKGKAAEPLTEPRKLMELQMLCRQHTVGCDACLVLLTPEFILLDVTELRSTADLDDRLVGYERYLETFDDPKFNPRWRQGTAEFVEVVDF